MASPGIWYSVPVEDEQELTCLLFFRDTGKWGRVLFEGFDAIRCCRGEYMPYDDDWSGTDYSQYPWVWEVEGSRWLQDRHEYEFAHYQTPLLDEYVHYLFTFHDEFVEVIAQGIWFEEIRYEEAGRSPSPDHPFMGLPLTLPAEEFVVSGIRCAVRRNPLSVVEVARRSALCSQPVFQYYMTLDGVTGPSYRGLVRTIQGRTATRLRGGLFYKELASAEGIAEEATLRPAFAEYVTEVAERRRAMGKSST